MWKLSPDPHLASRELYQQLREFSSLGHHLILIQRDHAHVSSDWLGIWNRLEKAKTLELTQDLRWLE